MDGARPGAGRAFCNGRDLNVAGSAQRQAHLRRGGSGRRNGCNCTAEPNGAAPRWRLVVLSSASSGSCVPLVSLKAMRPVARGRLGAAAAAVALRRRRTSSPTMGRRWKRAACGRWEALAAIARHARPVADVTDVHVYEWDARRRIADAAALDALRAAPHVRDFGARDREVDRLACMCSDVCATPCCGCEHGWLPGAVAADDVDRPGGHLGGPHSMS